MLTFAVRTAGQPEQYVNAVRRAVQSVDPEQPLSGIRSMDELISRSVGQRRLSMSPEGVKITPKGARKGQEITWATLLSGDADLRRDLNVSVDAYRG